MNITIDRKVIEQALAALEYMDVTAEHYVDNRIPESAITALRTALEQPEQEPVAWEDVLEAIARGWTHDDNKHKTMDVQLAVAIAKEVQDMVSAPFQRKPLPPQAPCEMTQAEGKIFKLGWRECEAAHGIVNPSTQDRNP